jgi:hypothetical protein
MLRCKLEHFLSKQQQHKDDEELPEIYCIMVTGKDACRGPFALRSVDNFIEQDYPRKQLVILNHSPSYQVMTQQPNNTANNIHEFMIDKIKNKMTLGDLRNIGLAMVPPGAIWTTWDDDDYRQTNYLSIMQHEMERTNADVLAFTERTEYNANTGLVWRMSLKSGFSLIFSKQDMRVLYERENTMEDINIIKSCRALGKQVVIYENNPEIYVRVVHGNNTSLFVEKIKEKTRSHNKEGGKDNEILNYTEHPVNQEYATSVRGFMSTYFKNGIECYHNNKNQATK